MKESKMDVYSAMYWNMLQVLVKLCQQIQVKYSKTAYLWKGPHDDLKMLCYGTKTKAHDDCHRLKVAVVVVKTEPLY